MKLEFAGVGSAFTTREFYQSNLLVTANSGKRLLIDCGSDIRFSLGEMGLGAGDIDAVYISHLHADHVGGLEWLAFCRYFGSLSPSFIPVPELFVVGPLMEELWEHSLRGGLESIEGKLMTLTDYFRCCSLSVNCSFIWEGLEFQPVQTVHVMSGYKIKNSYGLLISSAVGGGKQVFFTADTQFCPNQIRAFYQRAEVIFQDCETADFKSGVHAHYDDLRSLPEEIRRKMWLYHYPPSDRDAVKDGFAGFVRRGQRFLFDF